VEILNELALFAGAGGGILGGHLLGWRTVCAVEWEPYPASVLCARQNDGILSPFPIWDDVQTFDGKPWRGIVDVVSGGFPCQDISSAGGGQALLETNQECGNTWQGLLGRYDPSTHSLKTAQCSLFEDLKPSSVTLPRWGSMQDGELYQRQTLVRPILENESGLWPTITATANQLSPSMQSRYARPIMPNGIDQFHTPTTGGLDGGSNSRKALKKRMENWPTPTAHNAKEAAYPAEFLRKTPTLAATVAIRKFPTPQASDNRDRGNMSNPSIQRRVAMGKQIMLSQSVDQNSGQLNPPWVEWLMGWPLEWTDLKPLETDKFQEWQQQHGDY